MDVRCEKCNTEYELDEARLKPGGVTVKCTTCGHMFKIRKRSPTQGGIPVVRAGTASAPPPPRAPTAPAPRGPTPAHGVPQPRAQTGSGPVTGGEGERNWILRLDNGETRQCRELGILQQWIITGLVSRESMISRSGKTWKRLGDIAELSSFFVVADEARDVRAQRESGQITPPRGGPPAPERETVVEPVRGTGTGRHAAPPPAPRATTAGPAVAPARPATATPPPPPRPAASPPAPAPRPAATPPPPAPAVVSAPPPPPAPPPLVASAPLPAPPAPSPSAPAPAPPAPAPPAPSPFAPIDQRATGAWASDEVKPLADDVETVGPRRGAVRASGGDAFGGVVRPVPTDDVAFAGGLAGRRDAVESFDAFADDEPPRRKGAGLWIALGSLVVIGAAAGVVYFTVLRTPAATSAAPGIDAGAEVAGGGAAGAIDAGVALAPEVDAAVVAPADDLLDQARVQLARDSGAALSAAERLLAEGGRSDATTLAMRARLVSAQVQILMDEADLTADTRTADKVRREGKQLVLTALSLAQKALKAGPQEPLANVAMADVLRLQGKPLKELRRYLDVARQAAPGDPEAGLVNALVAVRDKDYDRAVGLLRALDQGQGALEASGDVRPRWHLARVAFLQKRQADARAAAEAVLAAQPEHAGARALLARVGAVAVDPMPDEDPGTGGGATGGGATGGGATGGGATGGGATGGGATGGGATGGGATGGGATGGGATGGGPTGDDYDKLLARANKLAEVDCGQAMAFYTRALEVQPNGVEALTGMGYCHIDAKQFASAHSKFRAALGISPRFERALWGVAEAYQQQGRADLAITAYEKYLAVYPGSAAAQRQLDRLQGKSGGPTPPDDGSGGGGSGGGSGATEPPPDKPAPTPEPTPEPGPSTDPGP